MASDDEAHRVLRQALVLLGGGFLFVGTAQLSCFDGALRRGANEDSPIRGVVPVAVRLRDERASRNGPAYGAGLPSRTGPLS